MVVFPRNWAVAAVGLCLCGSALAQDAELDRLQQRVDQIGETLQRQVIPLLDANDTQLKEMSLQLARIERMLEQLRDQGRASDAPPNGKAPTTAAAPAAKADARPAANADAGDWSVNVVAFSERSRADKEQARLAAMGIKAEIVEVSRGESTLYRVRIPGFGSREAAVAYIQQQGEKVKLGNAYPAAD